MANRIAFITGASRGIGRACAIALSAAGAKVVLAARQLDKLEEVAAEVRAAAGEAYVVPIDLASQDSIKAAFSKASKEFGRIDILINNAGLTRDGLALRMKRDDWDAVIQTNLSGSFFCIQQVMSAMVRERWGRIVNITSVVGESGNAGQANYAASKAGLIGLTKSLAQELASRNITVNAVAPGFIATEMVKKMPEKVLETMRDKTPARRLGEPHDVANAYLFLASAEADFINGAVLSVDGGLTL
jgi:3-oxoacyl-[acyl-carrier protein] reductase